MVRFQRSARASVVCAGIEAKALRDALGIDAGIELPECRGESLEVLGVAGGGDVGIGRQTGKAVEPRGEGADQDVGHAVPAEGLKESLRIERRPTRHGALTMRSDSRSRLRATDPRV